MTSCRQSKSSVASEGVTSDNSSEDVNFVMRQARLQAEARLALAQVFNLFSYYIIKINNNNVNLFNVT